MRRRPPRSTRFPNTTLCRSPGGSTLGGTTTVAAVGGVVTFNDLTLDKTAPGYWLTPTGLGPATSSPLNIIPGTASQLEFATHPGSPQARAPVLAPPRGPRPHPSRHRRQLS